MVFFDCNACGEAIKKNQVEKHYQFKCRNCTVLSCVDCGKSFVGDAYKEHVKCMTEDEKYGGKNYQAKASANKGERKQEAWVDQVQAAIDNVSDRNLKNILERVKGYSNIPRKKAKFVNFLKNSLRIQGSLPERTWDAISAEIAKNQPEPSSNGTVASNGTDNGSAATASAAAVPSQPDSSNTEQAEKKTSKREKKLERQNKSGKSEKKDKKKSVQDETEEANSSKKKSKKRKRQEIEEEEEEEKRKSKSKKKRQDTEKENDVSRNNQAGEEVLEEEVAEPAAGPAGRFRWEDVITAVLRKADGKELAVKKLRKKVMAAYQEQGSTKPQSEEELLAKFNKKISKNPKFKVSKDRVKLV